jgi:signal recognition particle subunit SRP54
MNKLTDDQLEKGESQLKLSESIVNSMTKEERQNPDLLAGSPSRRRRIARGSGHSEKEVSKLVTDFSRMRTMMQRMGQGAFGMPGMAGPGGGMFGGPGGGMPQRGWRGYQGGPPKKKKKKSKKRKGFGQL